MSTRLLVLGWHNVEGTWCFPSRPDAGRHGLARQLRALRRYTNVVPLDAALRDLAEGRPLPKRAVALTFDDGYHDTLLLAAPLLRQLDLPATIFLVPGILSRTVSPWWERLAWAVTRARAHRVTWEGEHLSLVDPGGGRPLLQRLAERLKRRNRVQRERAVNELVELLSPDGCDGQDAMFLDWDGARELVRTGLAIGSHSMYHAILANESPEHQHADLRDSRELLQRELAVPADLFAYPNGTPRDYDATTIDALRAARHTHAITSVHGSNRHSTPPYEIRRIMMQPERAVPGLAIIARDLVREARAERATRPATG